MVEVAHAKVDVDLELRPSSASRKRLRNRAIPLDRIRIPTTSAHPLPSYSTLIASYFLGWAGEKKKSGHVGGDELGDDVVLSQIAHVTTERRWV